MQYAEDYFAALRYQQHKQEFCHCHCVFFQQNRGTRLAPKGVQVKKVTLDKGKLTSYIQMLHENESSVLASTDRASVKIKNVGNNQFVITFTDVVQGVPCTHCEGHVAVQGLSWQPYDAQSTPHRMPR